MSYIDYSQYTLRQEKSQYSSKLHFALLSFFNLKDTQNKPIHFSQSSTDNNKSLGRIYIMKPQNKNLKYLDITFPILTFYL